MSKKIPKPLSVVTTPSSKRLADNPTWNKLMDLDFDLTSVTPTLTIGLVLLGAFNVYYYYSRFGIDVVPFLEPTEVVFSFVTLLPLTFFVLLYLFLGIAIVHVLRIFGFHNRPFYIHLSIGMFIGGLGLLILAYLFNADIFGNYFGIMLLYLFFFTRLIVFDSLGKLRKFPKVALVCAMMIIYLVLQSNWKSSQIVEHKNHQAEVLMKLPNLTIRTNDSLFYIGSTKAYTFFWNAASKKSLVYPLSVIESMEIKDKTERKGFNYLIDELKQYFLN
jgi:hypothetical protein